MLSNFIYDVKNWGFGVAVSNARFLIGSSILPGNHKHISVLYDTDGEPCLRCEQERFIESRIKVESIDLDNGEHVDRVTL